MQTQDSNTRSSGAVNHPGAEEWMDFLYCEVPPERRRALQVHLSQCAECAGQVKNWRASMLAMNEWTLPAMPSARRHWQPVLKWAVAAAIVFLAGFTLGRQNSSMSRDVAELKTSVSQLSEELQSERALNAANTAAAGTDYASEQFTRLLTDYAKQDAERRAEDRQTFALALRELDSRLVKLRTELETVALNTQDGFFQTQQGLTELASLAASEGTKSDHIP